MSEASPQAALPVEGASAQPEMTEAQNQNTKGTGDTNGVDAKADVVNQLANDATGDAGRLLHAQLSYHLSKVHF